MILAEVLRFRHKLHDEIVLHRENGTPTDRGLDGNLSDLMNGDIDKARGSHKLVFGV